MYKYIYIYIYIEREKEREREREKEKERERTSWDACLGIFFFREDQNIVISLLPLAACLHPAPRSGDLPNIVKVLISRHALCSPRTGLFLCLFFFDKIRGPQSGLQSDLLKKSEASNP